MFFEFSQPAVSGIEQTTQAVGNVSKTLALFFKGLCGCLFDIELALAFIDLLLEHPDFFSGHGGESCIRSLFQRLDHLTDATFHLADHFVLFGGQRSKLAEFGLHG